MVCFPSFATVANFILFQFNESCFFFIINFADIEVEIEWLVNTGFDFLLPYLQGRQFWVVSINIPTLMVVLEAVVFIVLQRVKMNR